MIEEKPENRPVEAILEKPNLVQSFFNTYFQGDRIIWFLISMMLIFSILAVYSATGTLAFKKLVNPEYYLISHSLRVLVALVAIWLFHMIDYHYIARTARVFLLLSVPLLLITWRYGVTINDASRWLTIPFIGQSFQPSDLAKLALIAYVATMLSKGQKLNMDFQKIIVPILIWTGVICTLIGLSNLSNAILLAITVIVLMFVGRVEGRYILVLTLVGVFSIGIALLGGQRLETAKSRLKKYTNTELDFQAQQAHIAVATGGFLGKGPGRSDQRNFLPNPFSDFIYAIIVEEYGLLGGLFIIFLYLALLYRGVMITVESHEPFGGILAIGLAFSIVIQAFLNMAVSVGLVPITGVTMPLISMGGTSLLFTGIALGIVLAISRSVKEAN
ncbi:MAG: FtsW/RodA/SpoVE family cell cycle protein [Microscillaceae bacterium]|nr:FtsW/RodA/SpoVE family cell cycle protein [Microscillaceae bacterium]MDW8460036.1 FtsW/RodA/SpoVE family cell cycle protein [Cytophagales bacterium]